MGFHSDGEQSPLPGPSIGPGATHGPSHDFDLTLPASAMSEWNGEGERPGGAPGAPAAAMAMAAPMPRAKPTADVPEIADVTVGELLGKGGQGVVYRGHQEFLARDVAIKVLHRSVDRDLARFRQEATLLASLHHPNIVACYQAGVGDDNECYMVLEFVDGPDLFGYVKAHGVLKEAQALGLALDVARGLEHGYEQGSRMIHRDIKPQNILIQDRGTSKGPRLRAKVVDLGLAKCLEESMELTQDGTVMGTPISMAPEQFDDPKQADHRTDIYGLGCVLFYALTGDPAFKGATITSIYKQKTTSQTARPHRDLRLSDGTMALMDKMLCPEQAGRHASYEELIEGIRGAMDALKLNDGAGWTFRRWSWAIGLGGAGVLLGAGLLLAAGEEPAPGEKDPSKAASTAATVASIAAPVAAPQPPSLPSLMESPDAPAEPLRVLPGLLDPVAPGSVIELIQRDSQLMSWRGDYRGHGAGTREHAFWRFGLDGHTPSLEGQPLMSFEGEQVTRSTSDFLRDLRGRGSVEPQYVKGASELSHRLPEGNWTFEGDLALRRRSFAGELLGGICFHRGDGSFMEVSVGVVLASAVDGEGAGPRRLRAIARTVWFGPDGSPMGEAFSDSRDFPGETALERSKNFMAEGAVVAGEREEVVLSLRLEHFADEGILLRLGDYLVLDVATPVDFEDEPIRQVAAFARIGDVALRRWRLTGD